MTAQQKGLILLVKSAITGQAYTLPEDFDINEAFETAKKHGITAIIYYGAYNCGVDSKSDAMKENFLTVYKHMMICAKQDSEIQRLLDAFEANGIKYLPLKGINIRKLYPKPEMRRMGDADILIDVAQYDQIHSLMLKLGYSEEKQYDHELPWVSRTARIELHKRLVPKNNKDYYRYFKDCWRSAKLKDAKKYEYQLSHEDEFIFVFAHFAKHYRSAGIGIRHFIDLWVLKSKYTDLNIEYVRTELNKLELLEFYDNIVKTIAAWFEDVPLDEKSDFITQVIFTSGEYGKISTSLTSRALIEKKDGKTVADITRRNIFKSFFVDYDTMRVKYPILNKLAVLLPLIWIIHFIRRIFQKNKLKSFIKSTFTVKDSEVSDYQKSLRFVGLDFNFGDEED